MDAVISSPLRRCASFAAAWCHQQQLTLAMEPAWREIDFGAWEGLTAEQIALQEPDALQLFYQCPALIRRQMAKLMRISWRVFNRAWVMY